MRPYSQGRKRGHSLARSCVIAGSVVVLVVVSFCSAVDSTLHMGACYRRNSDPTACRTMRIDSWVSNISLLAAAAIALGSLILWASRRKNSPDER